MNKDLVFYVAASALAVGVGVFVFWGPSTGFRKRKVPVIGLKNLGFTCFLNSLLQALASCPIFIDWLELSDYGNCISQSLLNILKLLSTETESFISGDESFSPSEVMHALRQNGWSISPGEQDAHELFHHLILTIEEEAMKEAKSSVYGCLSDALLPVSPLPPNVVLSSKSLFSGVNKDTMKNDSNKNVMAVRSMTTSTNIVSEPKSNGEINQLNFDISGKGDLAEVDLPPKYDLNRNRKPSPFTGFLTSQTMCRECGFKSVLRYDKFDSLSLHLPPLNSGCLYHTLTQLLERFVTTEVVAGVSCDGCNKSVPPEGPTVKSTALKSLSIGKLPQCLCIHIPRTLIHENGEPYKRQDYVEFPEYLIMDPFTQNQMNMDLRLKKQNMCSAESAPEIKLEMGDSESIKLLESNKNVKANGDIKIRKINHIYRIKAVVVHRGALQGGHFVTYRRGPLRSNSRHRLNQSHHTHGERRWYLTSDADVRDATLSEALKSPAYMLFYEKCAKDFDDVNNRPCTKSVPDTATY